MRAAMRKFSPEGVRRRAVCGPALGGPRSHATREKRVRRRVRALLDQFGHAGLAKELRDIARLGLPGHLAAGGVQLVVGSRAASTHDRALRAFLAYADWVDKIFDGEREVQMPPDRPVWGAYIKYLRRIAAGKGTPSTVDAAVWGMKFVCRRVFGVEPTKAHVVTLARAETARLMGRAPKRAREYTRAIALWAAESPKWGRSQNIARRLAERTLRTMFAMCLRYDDLAYFDFLRSLVVPKGADKRPLGDRMVACFSRGKTRFWTSSRSGGRTSSARPST